METLSVSQRAFFEQAATQYQSDLAASTAAQVYLTSRGIGPAEAVRFRLGVVTCPLAGHEALRNRLVIPYITPSGVVNFSFRCLKQHVCKDVGCPKYLPIEGMQRNIYNVLDLKVDSPFICVTEGEIDALTLSICGLPAIGLPGVKQWKDHFARCLEDFDVVFAFGDGDDAGGKFSSFLAKEAKARPISMPRGMDVNAIYQAQGADGVRRLIAE